MIVLLLAAGVAAPAAAAPVNVFFDDPSGYGVLAASAEGLGIPFVYPEVIGSASGILDVSQELQGSNASILSLLMGDTDNTATSLWTVENESDSDLDLPEETYFLFVTATAFSIADEVVVYDSENVGLSIDPEDGWVFVRTSTEPGEGYYYPAIKLGPLAVGEEALPFAVNYVVNEPIQQVGNEVVLPQLVAGIGYTMVPEPATGILLGVGLALLAVFHRRRS
jgi:hypothetical protein